MNEGLVMTEEEIKQAKKELNELTLTLAYWQGDMGEEFIDVQDTAYTVLDRLQPHIGEEEYFELEDYLRQAVVFEP